MIKKISENCLLINQTTRGEYDPFHHLTVIVAIHLMPLNYILFSNFSPPPSKYGKFVTTVNVILLWKSCTIDNYKL